MFKCSKTKDYTEYTWIYCFIISTFEEIDLLLSIVTRSRQSKRCVHMIGNFVKAHADISRIVLIHHTVIKPPVLISLRKVLC